jgi:hypothetical protein
MVRIHGIIWTQSKLGKQRPCDPGGAPCLHCQSGDSRTHRTLLLRLLLLSIIYIYYYLVSSTRFYSLPSTQLLGKNLPRLCENARPYVCTALWNGLGPW